MNLKQALVEAAADLEKSSAATYVHLIVTKSGITARVNADVHLLNGTSKPLRAAWLVSWATIENWSGMGNPIVGAINDAVSAVAKLRKEG